VLSTPGAAARFSAAFCYDHQCQGRKSRWRDADDVERLVRANLAQGVFRFFITDDNFARNRNLGGDLRPADRDARARRARAAVPSSRSTRSATASRTLSRRRRAPAASGSLSGFENNQPDSLLQAKKKQNRVHEYRQMFLAWRAQRVITYAGYILGFPGDTPERIARDIRTVQQELPVDLLEFFILTPLPGSARPSGA